MKAGTKLKSAVCDTEVMVIRGTVDGVFECGGVPMVLERGERAAIQPGFSSGSIMGKRYTDETGGVELLCIKPGEGALAMDGTALKIKDAKPLPSSD